MLALSVAMCISTVTYTAYAAPPQAITLQGTILTPSGLPLETASVGFTVEIRSPGAENCLLYRETHTLNMTNSGGAFSLPIGTGVRAGGGFQETSTLSAVFDNDSADITGLTCQTGSNYDPASGDTRKVSITFDDGTGPQNLNQTLSVQSVPFALHAQSTNTLGPYGALDFLVLNPLSGLTQTNLDLVFASNANVTELLALINGTSTLFAKSAGAQTFSGAVTLSSPGTALSVTNNTFIGGTTTIGGVTSITNTTASTSSTTGALTINGGIGVAENLNAGGAVNAATTLSAGTSLMTPIIYGSSAASGTLTLQSTSNTTKGNILMNPDGGNVGVGTAAPGDLLHVSKNQNANTNMAIENSNAGNTASASISLHNDLGSIGSLRAGSSTFALPQYASRLWLGASTNSSGVDIGAVSGTGDVRFYTGGALTTNERLRITSTGNVGIGTTSPTDNLHVFTNNTQTTPQLFIEQDGTGDAAIELGIVGDSYILGVDNSDSDKFKISYNGTQGSGVLGTNDRFVINSSGNIGIGTGSPNAKLDVNDGGGGIGYVLSMESNGSLITFGDALSTFGRFQYSSPAGATAAPTPFVLFDSGAGGGPSSSGSFFRINPNAVPNDAYVFEVQEAGTPIISVPGNGNVGIGTTSPTDKLDVIGGARVSGDFNVDMGTLYVDSTNNRIGINTIPSAKLSIQAAGNTSTTESLSVLNSLANPMFLVRDDGNVGIGVTGPTSKLQVAGDITPDTTASKNLGSGSLRWNNIYLSNAPDVSSDARLKKDVQTSDLGLDFINSLRPVSWTWKDQSQGTTQHYGVIAQEAESAIAKAKGKDSSNVIVTHNEETDSYSVRYTELISPLIKAIQELYNDLLGVKAVNDTQDREIASKADKTEVDQLKADNVAKDKKIKELEQRLEQIEKSLKSK